MNLDALFDEALFRVKDISEKAGQTDDAKGQAYVSNQTAKLLKKLEEAKEAVPVDQLQKFESKMVGLAEDIRRLNIPHHNLHNQLASLLDRYADKHPGLLPLFEKARTLPQIRKAIDEAKKLVSEDPLATISFDQVRTEPALYYRIEARYGKDRTAHIIHRVQEIEEHAQTLDDKKKQAYIHTQCRRLADQENRHLGWEVDKNTGQPVATSPNQRASTYMKTMSRYRNAIKSLGYKHHALEYHLNRLINEFDQKYPGLELAKKLNPKLTLKTLRQNVIKLIKSGAVVKDSEIYKALRSLPIEHYAYYAFKPVAVAEAEREVLQEKSLEDKKNLRVWVNPDWVKQTATKLIAEGVEELGGWLSLPARQRPVKRPYAGLVIGLAMASGRRQTEIMKTGVFIDLKDQSDMVEFSGQLKTKYRSLYEDLKPYPIPLLVDKELFFEGMDVLRRFMRTETVKVRDYDGSYSEAKALAKRNDVEHTRAVAQKYGKTLTDAASRILGHVELNFKDTRAIYAAVGSELFGSAGQHELEWIKQYLGHSDAKTRTAEHYLSFKVNYKVDSIEFIHGTRKRKGLEKQTASGDVDDKPWLEHLEKSDRKVLGNRRAKVWPDLHEWLKDKVRHGLSRQQIYQEVANSNRKTDPAAWLRSYIRKNCLVNGKSLNPGTVAEYITGGGLGMNDNLEIPKGGE